MKDRTASTRVRKYRDAQKSERGIVRVEMQVPAFLSENARAVGRKYQWAFQNLQKARGPISSILATINAPRPRPIGAEKLLACLLSDRADPDWRPHIRAFFDEVSVEAIHDIVLAGVVSFEDLLRAARLWRVTDGRSEPWIREMADLRMAGNRMEEPSP